MIGRKECFISSFYKNDHSDGWDLELDPGMHWHQRVPPLYIGKFELFNTGIAKMYFVLIWILSASERNIYDYAPGNCSSVILNVKLL